jgi:hypothetical protein
LLVQRVRYGGHLPDSQPAPEPGNTAVQTKDEEDAAALADAIEATIAKAEEDMAAAASAARADAEQRGELMPAKQPSMLPPCEVDAAVQSAAKLFLPWTRFQASASSTVSETYKARYNGGGADSLSATGSFTKISSTASLPIQLNRNLQSRVVSARLRIRQHWRQLLGDSSGSSALHKRQPRFSTSTPHWIVAAGYAPLSSHCPLFARKLTAAVTNHTLAMALSCAGIGLGSWCSA